MSKDSRYLAAFTPGGNNGYHFYPPFVNFTQFGDSVRIILRETDSIDEKTGWNVCGKITQMDIPLDDFVKLIDQAKGNIVVDAE
jgi:hypothetical protein